MSNSIFGKTFETYTFEDLSLRGFQASLFNSELKNINGYSFEEEGEDKDFPVFLLSSSAGQCETWYQAQLERVFESDFLSQLIDEVVEDKLDREFNEEYFEEYEDLNGQYKHSQCFWVEDVIFDYDAKLILLLFKTDLDLGIYENGLYMALSESELVKLGDKSDFFEHLNGVIQQ